ncbi:protein kintoun [Suncus etruscus]|uniref:protein kintoun n=1 Tax=Suncus etruscus TaxID=109475 RepID=UPI0021109F4B|nr:protein kintoun [Suncus etruscus]
MARRASASPSPSPLDDLDLSGEEVRRLTSAFRDPEFRRLFSEYSRELTDPENRRRYEAEIAALERERGVQVRFVHPQPGHALRTSLDGARRCFVNVCSNALVGEPRGRPGSGGSRWSLPYSLAPGREYAGGGGARYTVYDVVFHPDALELARRHDGFLRMLDATALDAVERQFQVRLDRRNVKTLKGTKYKGTPEAAVLRSPLPGGAPARPEEEPGSPLLQFPYPYPEIAARSSAEAAAPEPRAHFSGSAPAPTEPRYEVVQRHHVDLQDYRCSRDSAPSPVPQELVVTIELPLLRSAEQAALEVTGKLLSLDSRRPDYRLRLKLPYPVDDSRGRAQFNKARRQLIITLPVAAEAARLVSTLEPEKEPAGSDGAEAGNDVTDNAPAGNEEMREAGSLARGDSSPAAAALETDEAFVSPSGSPVAAAPPEAGVFRCFSSGEPTGGMCGGLASEARAAPLDGAMGGPGAGSGEEALCPPLHCAQDAETLTLLVRVPRIRPQSLQGNLSPLCYRVRFSTEDASAPYAFSLQFAPENRLSPREPVVDVSPNNAVIGLAKSPGSYGLWREWYCGVDDDSLQERLFINEDNVDVFLEEVTSTPSKQTKLLTPPLIEVLQITDSKIQIHAEFQENSNSDLLHEKEERVSEGSHLTEKENITSTTSKSDSDSSSAVKAPETEDCSSVVCLQQESTNGSQIPSGKSQQPQSEMKPEYIQEVCTICSEEDKDSLKETEVTEEKNLDGDQPPSTPNKTRVLNVAGSETIKETNLQDGSVQIIKDHVTNCAFSFQNSLLYDLD